MKKLLFFILATTVSCCGFAQDYPAKPVRMIVPFPAGSTPDIVGRTLGQKLSAAWHQPIVVDNKTGAAGNIGTAEAAHAQPDGYTLLIGINGPIAVNKALYKDLPYDPQKDLQPLSLLASGPQLLAVHPSVPAKDLRELVAYARANPDKLSYGSVGAGSASHLTMELLKFDAGISLVHVPYRGFPPLVQDLLAGNIQAAFAIVPAVLPQVKAGRLRALAVTSARRSPLTPDIATVAEQGFPQFDATAWIGLLAPAPLPSAVAARIADEARHAMQLPEVRELLGRQGFDVVGGSPEDFAAFIKSETAKWSAVVKSTGARAE